MKFKHGCAIAATVAGLFVAPLAAQQAGLNSGVPAAQQQGQKYGNPTAAMDALMGFNIVLLVGESNASGASRGDQSRYRFEQALGAAVETDVPAAARKALADMKDFLPFKMYRVLDSQWTSCCARSMSTSVAGRLLGVMVTGAESGGPVRLLPRNYSYSLHVSPASGKLSVRFSMGADDGRPNTGADHTGREINLQVQLSDAERTRDALLRRRNDLTNRVGDRHPDMIANANEIAQVDKTIARLQNDLETRRADEGLRGKPVMDSSFSMEAGETVVVGTSRLGGDKALIALVTAARKSGAR